MDLILTGREVCADEALAIGLANRVVPTGRAEELATQLAALPASVNWCVDSQTSCHFLNRKVARR
jgi:enoyl-CoA hydratase/carnithine racemase